jgi:uncharacterized protein (UPF0332 family)
LPEAEGLLREGRQALRAAEVLHRSGLYGDAVTRAYYAMLYAARALLATRGVHPRTHGGVLQALGLHYVKPGLLARDLAKAFGLALESRQRADYGSLIDFSQAQAEEILGSARAFVERVERLMGGESG